MLWFKHDTNASNDAKLKKVRMKYGSDGYAIYWYCLECIAGRVDKNNLTFNLEEDSEIISYELNVVEHRVEEIMQYMVSLGLFEEADGIITCLKLAKRIDKSMTNSPKMRKWLDIRNGKSVMTLSDTVSACPELEVEKELEQNTLLKDLCESDDSNPQSQQAEKINKKPKPNVPYEEIKKAYLDILVNTGDQMGLVNIKVLSDKRKRRIKQYWTKNSKHGIEGVKAYFKYIWDGRESHSWIFGDNRRGWVADIEFLLREDTLVRARENTLSNWQGE